MITIENARSRADITKPFRQSFALPPPLPTEVEAWVSAETKARLPSFRVSETEVIPLLGEMSATADKRVPVFRRKSVGAILLRLKGILLDVRY